MTQSLKHCVDAYLPSLKKSSSRNWFDASSQSLKLFSEHLHQSDIPLSTPISSIGVGEYQSFLSYLQTNRSVETEHLYTRAILGFTKYLTDNDFCDLDTDLLQQYYEEHRRTKDHSIEVPPLHILEELLLFAEQFPVPTPSEENLRDTLRILRDRAFIHLLADTGLKLSEACALRCSHFNTRTNTIDLDSHSLPLSPLPTRLIKSYLSTRAKLDQQQKHLTPDALPLFSRHDKRASDKILPISRWTGANIVDGWVKQAFTPSTLASLNAPITPHTFRHYFVLSTLTKNNNNLPLTQKLARHENISTTRQYLDLLDSSKETESE